MCIRDRFNRTAGKLTIIDDISFKIRRGETLGLVGESGCGKTTAAKAILKLLKEDVYKRQAHSYLTDKLGKNGQGIVLLHHSLLSYPKWDLWTQVSGVKVRCEDGVFEYHQNEAVCEHIEVCGLSLIHI